MNAPFNTVEVKDPVELADQIPDRVLDRYMNEKGVDRAVARTAHIELMKFLILSSNEKLLSVPSKALDEVWHNYLLHTREYNAFCIEAFGKFIHHDPEYIDDDIIKMLNLYMATRSRVAVRFGELSSTYWPDITDAIRARNEMADCTANCMGTCH